MSLFQNDPDFFFCILPLLGENDLWNALVPTIVSMHTMSHWNETKYKRKYEVAKNKQRNSENDNNSQLTAKHHILYIR